jgi:hypothetical protein
MSWTDFSLSVPDGSSGNGASFEQGIKDNQHALWNFIMAGMAKGMLFSASGGTAQQPDTILFGNGTNILKCDITWGTTGGALGNFGTIDFSSSQNNGSSYTAAFSVGFTYDSNGNLTATTGGGGMFAFIAMLLGRTKANASDIATINLTLATLTGMAFQDPSSVAITGGFAKGIPIGGTGSGEAKEAYHTFIRRKVVDLAGGTPANTFTLDFALGDYFLCAPGANFTFVFNNFPANGWEQEVLVEVTGGAGFTATLPAGATWGSAGAPVWTAGPDIIRVIARGHASTPTKRFVTVSLA